MRKRLAAEAMSVDELLKSTRNVRRIPATAVYLTSNPNGVPPALLHNLKANHVLHERILLVTVETALTPRVLERTVLVRGSQALGASVPTSATGTKRTSMAKPSMSALAGKADIADPRSNVR